jgi:hypothetical protein
VEPISQRQVWDLETPKQSGLSRGLFFTFDCSTDFSEKFSLICLYINLALYSCLFLQFLTPLGLTLVLAAILVKTSTIYSIFISTFQVRHHVFWPPS